MTNALKTNWKIGTLRGNKLEAGQFHLVVSIFPINSKNQVLVQRKKPNLKLIPGEWAATGGSAKPEKVRLRQQRGIKRGTWH